MSNRLIGLLIILFIIISGISYIYFSEKKEEKNNIIENKQIKNTNEVLKKQIEKKAELIEIIEKDKGVIEREINRENKNVFSEDKENILFNIKRKAAEILKDDYIENINVKNIDGEKNIFLIEYNRHNNKLYYLYNNKISNLEKINLNIPIIYIKKSYNNNLAIITEKGTFIYDNKTKKLDYFSMFYDFILYNGNYIGIIKNSDKIRKVNFNFKEETGDLIVLNNPKKSEKKLLYKANFKIKKILFQNNKIIIVDENDVESELKF